MTAIKTLKRISVKELLGLKRADSGKEKIQELLKQGITNVFTITGRVTGFASKATQYGENFALIGEFLARNDINGELHKSTKAYLPKDFTENVIAQFQNREANSSAVEFSAHVKILEDSASATGYTYIVEPIETIETMAWQQQAMKTLLALPAPIPVEKKNGKK